MKILFLSEVPCSLAHGGTQVVADKLMQYLPQLNIAAEPLRWWDCAQTGDVLHYIGSPPVLLLDLARRQGMSCVMTQFLDQTSSRSTSELLFRRIALRLVDRAPALLRQRSPAVAYRKVDAAVFVDNHEKRTAQRLYKVDEGNSYVVSHGLDPDALRALAKPSPATAAPYLVSLATIVERKNTLILARAAKEAQVPIHFIGRPLSTSDPYFQQFSAMIDDEFVVYRGYIDEDEKHATLIGATGFALLSEYESGCLAVYEAAAAGLPLLLSDLPWARHHYPPSSAITRVRPYSPTLAAKLRDFYVSSRRRDEQVFPVASWPDVARRYASIYQRVLS